MKIEHYIPQLLYRYQCVTVPGFGAFLTETQSAYLHENTNSFYPPKKVISFNSHLKNNDGLLANHISQSEKTSYENAVAAIESEVIIWQSILQVNNKFSLKNVGELSLNDDKNLVFTPSENINYLTQSFGLNSFVSPFIKREILKSIVGVVEEKEPIIFIPEVKRSRPYLKYAAILALALSATGTIGYKLYNDKIAADTLVVEASVQKQVQSKIQEATFFIENPIPAVTLTVKEEKLSYHIMAGIFRSEENAQHIYSNLLASGYNARRLAPNRRGLFTVLYGSFASRAEAEQALIGIHKSSSPDAWVFVKEL